MESHLRSLGQGVAWCTVKEFSVFFMMCKMKCRGKVEVIRYYIHRGKGSDLGESEDGESDSNRGREK